jgi:hypothetical protein
MELSMETIAAPVPATEQRRRRSARWLILVLAIVFGCALLGMGGAAFLIQRGVAEVRSLAPWPGANVSAEEVATIDLSALGLEIVGREDAREVYGDSYADGALISYGTKGGTVLVTVAALRYPTAESAAEAYGAMQGWAAAYCLWRLGSSLGTAGAIGCHLPDGHDRILWNREWILDITAMHGGPLSAAELSARVRDAVADGWRGRTTASR